MSNDQPKLTLERWAALDPIRYRPESNLYPTLVQVTERCRLHEQAASRLLAALRGLIEKWDGHADGLVVDEADWVQQCAQDLRHLIEQTDLADPEQPR